MTEPKTIHTGPICSKKDCMWYGDWDFLVKRINKVAKEGMPQARSILVPMNSNSKYEALTLLATWCPICKHSNVDLYLKTKT